MSRKRTIAVVTGSRAEFGLLSPVMRAVEGHSPLRLRTIVTGTHLTAGTWRDIERAGFRIDARVRMQQAGRVGRGADTRALGLGVTGIGRVLENMRPDFVVVLGDRIEVLAAASAASVGGFRVAHIHGGDRAEGVADEAIRHAVTKLAHVHFPATAQSRQRIIRMGEPAARVFNVGSPAVDGLSRVKPLKDGPTFIVAQHPIGESDAQEGRWMRQTLAAVYSFADRNGIHIVAPNTDPGSDGIRRALRMKRGQGHVERDKFLAMLKGAAAIIGNSSAGLIEAAALRVPAVNIGPRQAGRQRPRNVIECDYAEQHVRRAIARALRLNLSRMKHPYGLGRAGERIAKKLADINLDRLPLRKQNVY